MKTIIDKANTRGYFNHGWLKTYHTFSFADYYNPRRIHFGSPDKPGGLSIQLCKSEKKEFYIRYSS